MVPPVVGLHEEKDAQQRYLLTSSVVTALTKKRKGLASAGDAGATG
jgi:hypothetical protein